MASLVAQMVKNLPAMWETWVGCLGWEDPLEKGMAAHSSALPWRTALDRGAWEATVHGVTKSRTRLSNQAQLSAVHTVRFGLNLDPLLVPHFLFLLFRMVMSILYLSHHCALKIFNLFELRGGEQKTSDEPHIEFHAYLIWIIFRWGFGLSL